MKKTFLGISSVILFVSMLIFPKAVLLGSSNGLLLWFHIIIPTLFPFLLLSTFLLSTRNICYITNMFGSFISYIFGVSQPSSYCILVGFLCGYPLGAKTVADFVRDGLIPQEEGRYLLSFCNNTSPSFVMNYLVLKTLNKEKLLIPTLFILFFSSYLISIFERKHYHFTPLDKHFLFHKPVWSIEAFDLAVLDTFESLVKIGGYIIFFSVLLTLCQQIPFRSPIFQIFFSSLEITNGLKLLMELPFSFQARYILCTGLTAFGGFCSVAQTNCMLHDTDLSICSYTKQKLAAAVTASILCMLYCKIQYTLVSLF